MSRRSARIEQAESGIAEVQKVLEHAQGALETAGRIDEAATTAATTARRSRPFLKLVLVLGVVAVIVIVARKVMSSPQPEPDIDDYSGGGLA